MNPPPNHDRPRGLGRGLSALIGDEVAAVKGEPARAKDVRSLPVAFLRPGKYQPRKSFEEQPLADLAASIREKGVLSPILVRPVGPDAYEIVAGERRWRAAQLAKLHDVPVVVRELPDDQALEIAIIENVQRADLNVIEEAAAYEELIEKFGRTQEDVAREVRDHARAVAGGAQALGQAALDDEAVGVVGRHREHVADAVAVGVAAGQHRGPRGIGARHGRDGAREEGGAAGEGREVRDGLGVGPQEVRAQRVDRQHDDVGAVERGSR